MLIERLKGVYAVTLPTGIILDVQGVGYGVDMPLSAMCNLPPEGSTLEVWVHTYVREDAIKLFGFLSYEDRAAFEILLSVSGVGPKVALAILSTLSTGAIRKAIVTDNHGVFEAVPGVGKRLAEKILVDLKPKLKKLQALQQNSPIHNASSRIDDISIDELTFGEDEVASFAQDAVLEDIRSALENLGFREKEIAPLLENLKQQMPEAGFQELMKKALLELSGQPSGYRPPAVPRKKTPTNELF